MISTTTAEGLQKNINKQSALCRKRRLPINSNKWKTMDKSTVVLLSVKIEHTKSCLYLIHSLSRNWAYFRSTGSGFRDTGWFSRLPYLGVKFAHWPKFQKLHIYSFITPLSLFSLYGKRFPRPRPIFKITIFGMKLGHWPKFQKLHIYSQTHPWVPNFTPFGSAAGHFQDIENLSFSHWSRY